VEDRPSFCGDKDTGTATASRVDDRRFQVHYTGVIGWFKINFTGIIPRIVIEKFKNWGYQILSHLAFLHDNNLTHGCLSTQNILVDAQSNQVFLKDWGLCYLTDGGKLVEFPLEHPKFLSPEFLRSGIYASKVDYERLFKNLNYSFD
jgi:serine/threonine protein kinase